MNIEMKEATQFLFYSFKNKSACRCRPLSVSKHIFFFTLLTKWKIVQAGGNNASVSKRVQKYVCYVGFNKWTLRKWKS